MAYFYSRDGKQVGPHSAEEIQSFVAQGRLMPQEMIWQEGMPAWAPIHSVFPGIAPSPPSMPPPGYPAPHMGGGMAMKSSKTRIAYILLGVFLGGLGVHNFYAGYTGRGVAQLLICLFTTWLIFPIFILWIWCLIEVITVTKDSQGMAFS